MVYTQFHYIYLWFALPLDYPVKLLRVHCLNGKHKPLGISELSSTEAHQTVKARCSWFPFSSSYKEVVSRSEVSHLSGKQVSVVRKVQ